MKENLHIEKELLFKNNIKDITSISLDSNYNIKNDEVEGVFLVKGEYKTHELSLNKETFEFKIPFNYELNDDIDKDKVKVEITNFIYDYKKDELIVNIDYEITGDRKDILLFNDEESLDEFLKEKEIEIIDTRMDEIKDILNEDIKEEIVDERNNIDQAIEENNEKIIDNKTQDIMKNINTNEDKFITYKIYKITENDTLESLVMKYHTTLDELKEYNDLTNIKSNDKIIIPYYE